MAVTPLNLARVSHNLRAFNLLESLRATQGGLFRVQNQLSTGLRFLLPSEDPLRAANAGDLDRHVDRLTQVTQNLQSVQATLAAGESAASDGIDLLEQVRNIATEALNDTIATDERASLSVVVNSLLDQMLTVANRQHLGAHLFGGLYGDGPPFEMTTAGVLYHGDLGRRETIVDSDLSQAEYTIPGVELFGAVSANVRGLVDLDPRVTAATRISDLRGSTGEGVSLGQVRVTVGADQTLIDLSDAATIGDVVDRLNAEMPAELQAAISTTGINLNWVASGAAAFAVEDVAGGTAARDLGLGGLFAGTGATGADLDPILAAHTPLANLRAGAGLDLTDGFVIRNGTHVAAIDLSSAATLEDLLNEINQSDAGVLARVADDGRTLEVRNRISGANLSIEENGGTLATVLGIRSMRPDTTLASLNDGDGVYTVAGNDIRFITADGTTFEIDVDGAVTLQDVIDRINAAAGGALDASLATSGNGLVLADNTSGAGSLRLERVSSSPALDGLGLDVPAAGGALQGRDVSPVRVDSVFTAMLELRDALQADDERGMQLAGRRVERVLSNMQAAQGRLAGLSASVQERVDRVDVESTATRVLLSDVRDVDVTEAVVDFQRFQTALQANLQTASRVLNLSLLDYLS